ncbi:MULTISPECIES: hypothetical protein [Nocardia]|uniref:hypothetical protein n=1 Tax=Nocardia TaxID=1817 RepID=UPI00189463EB|nr:MULTISPECIES: hypothetical protein [Nocardia]MBF6351350.1 hypothetical protein [Nocardia flavorosea]
MTTDTAQFAGAYLAEVATKLGLPEDHGTIRAVLDRACGGQLAAHGPDGRRASTLTASGVPFEVSVTGGGGTFSPAIRYVTEAATQETEFGKRLAFQLDAIDDLVTWLPNGDETSAKMLRSFVSTLYPDTADVTRQHRSPTWLGIVHHAADPQYVARVKVYAGLNAVPGALESLRRRVPGFAGLAAMADDENLFVPAGAALEIDAYGEINHKIYLRTARRDAAVPMRLARVFGESVWEALSEFARCGIESAELYRYRFFVCCARRSGESVLGLHLVAGRRDDLTPVVRQLAKRHHGTSAAVDALARTAESLGGTWRYTAAGLSAGAGSGTIKLNVYGTPTSRPG